MRTLALAFALVAICAAPAALTGCASVKPHVLCGLDGKAQVMQGVSGIGVGQALADADSLCSPLTVARDAPKPAELERDRVPYRSFKERDAIPDTGTAPAAKGR